MFKKGNFFQIPVSVNDCLPEMPRYLSSAETDNFKSCICPAVQSTDVGGQRVKD